MLCQKIISNVGFEHVQFSLDVGHEVIIDGMSLGDALRCLERFRSFVLHVALNAELRRSEGPWRHWIPHRDIIFLNRHVRSDCCFKRLHRKRLLIVLMTVLCLTFGWQVVMITTMVST